jgi:MYXO-CTERM domain-containing protein
LAKGADGDHLVRSVSFPPDRIFLQCAGGHPFTTTREGWQLSLRRTAVAFAAMLLLSTSTAYATPILTTSGGDWLPVPPACECGGAPWNGHSDDGHNHNLGFVFEVLGLADGLEWLAAPDGQPGFFTLTEWAGVRFFAETARPKATLTESGGVLTYDDKHGAPFSSNGPSGSNGFFTLFRRALSTSLWRLYVGVNDTWFHDLDGQDGVFTTDYSEPFCVIDCTPPPPICLSCTPPPVDEPMALAFALIGLAGVLARRRVA